MTSRACPRAPGSGAVVALWTALAVAALVRPSRGEGGSLAPGPRPGEPVDLAAFGRIDRGTDGVAVEWDEPREVAEVIVRSGGPELRSDALEIDWWGSVWPAHGAGGWMKLDDPWNGRWVRVEALASVEDSGRTVRFRFPPLSRSEWQGAPDKSADPPFLHRRTLKVRVASIAEGQAALLAATVSCHGASRWAAGTFDVEVGLAGDGSRALRLEASNGRIASVESLPSPRGAEPAGDAWRVRGVAGASGGVRVRALYADTADRGSNDLTRIAVRLGESPESTGFSFVPQDVLAAGAMRLRDFRALVVPSGSPLTLAGDPGPDPGAWPASVRERVGTRAEATQESAMAGIPRLAPARWVPLGVPSARQEVFVGPAGDWSFMAMSIGSRVPEILEAGKDSKRIPFRRRSESFRDDQLFTRLSTRADPTFDGKDREFLVRSLEEDWLPWIHVRWMTGPISFHEELGATTLGGDYADDGGRRGDEAVALLVRITATNTGSRGVLGHVSLRCEHDAPLRLREDGVIEIDPTDPAEVPEGLRAVRGQVLTERGATPAEGWRIEPQATPGQPPLVRWTGILMPGEPRSVQVRAPYVDLLEPEEIARLASLRHDEEKARILGYWRARIERGMRLSVPSPALQAFYRANLWHDAITTDRDPVTGLYNHGVGTVQYHVFANETVMVARSMDLRGEHLEAERYLEPMLRFQGHEPLTGRFSTKEDAFHSAGPYTHGQYAMNHGFVLWGVAEHYLVTRDRAYLDRVAPQLFRGCDFLARERRYTMSPAGAPRSAVHGLAPASSLEDVVEFQYWLATNAYFHLGMKRVGQALAAAGRPEAERIAREAEAYRVDIERAAREAATRSAAVPLRSGWFVPYVPSRIGQWRHLSEGWIREALYPALHLATAEVVSPLDPLMTWMLDDLEDNIFFSWQSGYNVADFETTWFERGGITLQPCLLDTPAVYMARDEVPAALRAFWNTYALSIYPDVHCFAEWAPRFGQGGGPVYKTSDESRFVIWMRQLIIQEDGDRLLLGRGVPRAWLEGPGPVEVRDAPTWFGPMSLRIEPDAGAGTIRATIEPPRRDPPRETWLRLRHPEGKLPRRVRLDGAELARARVLGEDIDLTPKPGGPAAAAGTLEVVAEY